MANTQLTLKRIKDSVPFTHERKQSLDKMIDDWYLNGKRKGLEENDCLEYCADKLEQHLHVEPTWITQQRIVDIISVDDNLKNRISILDEYYVSIKFDTFSIGIRTMNNYVDIWVQEKTAYVVTSVPIPSTLSAYFSEHLRFTINCVINQIQNEIK